MYLIMFRLLKIEKLESIDIRNIVERGARGEAGPRTDLRGPVRGERNPRFREVPEAKRESEGNPRKSHKSPQISRKPQRGGGSRSQGYPRGEARAEAVDQIAESKKSGIFTLGGSSGPQRGFHKGL
jgi:hypothetical protein